MEWRFAESEEDGQAWLLNSSDLQAFVQFRSSRAADWRQIMVVTKSWVERQLSEVRSTSTGSGRAVFPAMLVVPDAEPARLREIVHNALSAGGVEHFAAIADDGQSELR